MSLLNDPVAYLAEHYVYEVYMLRRTYGELLNETDQFRINLLIESFCLHARSLLDFYKCSPAPRSDDVVATHFIASGQFQAPGSAVLAAGPRAKVNKQIAHMTASREGGIETCPRGLAHALDGARSRPCGLRGRRRSSI